jgi:hypothetical protein
MMHAKTELPAVEELSEFAREAFMALITAQGLPARHLDSAPTQQTLQTVDRLMNHAIQMAEAWAGASKNVEKLHERLHQQAIRRNKVFS